MNTWMQIEPLVYELKDELARLCLPQANRDPNRKLAWVNSICILFLLIGILGAQRGSISIKPPPPVEEIMPVMIEPATLPPEQPQKKNQPTRIKRKRRMSWWSCRNRRPSISRAHDRNVGRPRQSRIRAAAGTDAECPSTTWSTIPARAANVLSRLIQNRPPGGPARHVVL